MITSHKPAPLAVVKLLLIGTLGWSAHCLAATPGSDQADHPAYQKDNQPGWGSGTNGGSGFVGWNLISSDSSGGCGFFIGSSKKVAGESGADIDSNGKSFGMFAKEKDRSAQAYRTLGSPLEPGQKLAIELAVNFRSGQKGVDLCGSGGKVIFNFNVGSEDYVVSQALTGNGSIGATYHNNSSFTLLFTQTGPAGGTWKITRRGGVSATAEGSYVGVACGLKFYVSETDKGSENDLYVNHLTISQ